MENNNIYISESIDNTNMLPGDPNRLPDESLIFLDEGFIYKLSKHFGEGKPIKFDRIVFSKNISKKQNLLCKKIFYYNAPPFQSNPSIKEEDIKKEGYDRFIRKLQEHKEFILREGRCQRLKVDGKFIFKQKYIDVLITIDLMKIPLDYPKMKKIILVTSDSDFIPAIKELSNYGIKVILYTYYEKNRNTNFSRGNDLIKSVHKYVLLAKQDFENAPLLRKGERK
ncbi:NYN domain-containing protein [Candidatus Pacearchaeota archaeon]|nr:NYN domain-containing protein [Candidatus Pacearchaeota archaeon]